MISTTKVLCFVAIAFADSDFQTDHGAVMRELSGGEPEGLDTIEEFRELVGDTDEFRELADAIADEDREIFWKRWKQRKQREKREKCKKHCRWANSDSICTTSRKCRRNHPNRAECRKRCRAWYQEAAQRCMNGCRRQLDEDEEVSAAVLV